MPATKQTPVRQREETARERIAVADDDPAIRELLREVLEEAGYIVDEAATAAEVIALAARPGEQRPALILLDFRLPDANGIEVLERLSERGLDVPVILITGTSTANIVIRAIQMGAKEYLTKPLEDLHAVENAVKRVLRSARAGGEDEADVPRIDPSERMIGSTPQMVGIFTLIGRVARAPVTVLITGETGTGKELVAEALHNASDRRTGPLIKVNCPALPESLMESELFGHEKGAFTGALTTTKGRFEAANKGTIFLDEIGEMTLGTQSKLLRVLQEREFERVGSTTPVKVDVRVVAATNRDLWQEVQAGRFREDLYFRLNVIAIHMPPLRERKNDIPALVSHFLVKHRSGAAAAPARISQEAMALLIKHDWPGNVRELEHIIERAVVLSRGELITPEHIQFQNVHVTHLVDVRQQVQAGIPLGDIVRQVRREAIATALRLKRGDRQAAADHLDIPPHELDALLAESEAPADGVS